MSYNPVASGVTTSGDAIISATTFDALTAVNHDELATKTELQADIHRALRIPDARVVAISTTTVSLKPL